jgi:hypothetical protein
MISPKAIKKIQDYYNDPSDPETKRLFDWAAKQRGSKESTVEQIQEGTGLKRAYVIGAMKELDGLGFGQFVVGRRNKFSRMIWKVGLGDLGRCAQGSAVDFDDSELTEGTARDPDASENRADEILHFFHLRPKLRISLKLPSNLTPGEARRLADFILSLPFEEPKFLPLPPPEQAKIEDRSKK